MPSILVVEKNGDIKEKTIKTFVKEDLYKKAGFKSGSNFEQRGNWVIDNLKKVPRNMRDMSNKFYHIYVYGKTEGRANTENKYEFPPPIDNDLFFGNCLIINSVDGELENLSVNEWEVIYEHLYGGFDDLNEDEEESVDEEEDVPRTKSGYVKDDFIVDDDFEEKPKKKKKGSSKKIKNSLTKKVEKEDDLELMDYSDELDEEDYI
jgi:hypothetical protein